MIFVTLMDRMQSGKLPMMGCGVLVKGVKDSGGFAFGAPDGRGSGRVRCAWLGRELRIEFFALGL